MKLLKESLFISLILTVIGLVLSYIIMYIKSPEKTKEFKYWPSVAISFGLAGIIVHLLFEMSGINKLYCEQKN